MTQLRTFIAIDLPQPLQTTIAKETTRLQTLLGNQIVRWTVIENIHLTLKFLGNIPIAHLDFFKRMLTQTADAHTAFDLQLSGFGSFPNAKLPRILWLGIHPQAGLSSLQKDVEEQSARLGYEKEARAFSPHLTLGRVRQAISPSDLQKIRTVLGSFQLGKIDPARVDSIHLYQSDLHSEGSNYTKLFSAKLKN